MKNKDNVFIVFGDSISYGLYDKESCGWVNRLRKKLEIIANNNFVVNLGIPGQNSSDIKKRFEIELKNRYNNTDNFILIYAMGIKDAAILKENPNHINQFKENLKYIIDITKRYTNNINFIGLIEPDYLKRKEYNSEYVNKIDVTLKDICQENAVEYIEVRNIVEKLELTDGLHPDDNGHEKISSYVLENILKSR